MGQYYKPCILDTENKRTVKAFVYSHDYKSGLKLMEHSWLKNPFVKAFESLILKKPQRVVWAGDYAEPEKGLKNNAYMRCTNKLKTNPTEQPTDRESRYLVNYTKGLFVDKNATPDSDGWRIHPLPLLTCEGNGQGGGDYFGDDTNSLIGSWARDIISVEAKKPKGFKELIFDLVE
jgi:hypothetical protein